MSRNKLALALLVSLGVGLAACDTIKSVFGHGGDDDEDGASRGASHAASLEPEAGSTTHDPTPERGVREVEFPAVAESVSTDIFGADLSATFAGARVPVLAPVGVSREQAQRFADTFRVTPEGYFARLSLDDYDVVVNGTRAYAVAPEAAGARTRDTTQTQFGESETGLSATFSRFGADYSVDFVCRGAGDEGGMDCITQETAAEFVDRLVPVGGGGQ